MTENPRDSKPQAPRRPRLRLPFDNRREDAGTWAYDHRIGLCVTLIAYLLLMIVFVSSKIVVGARSHQQGMFIDLQSLAELEQEKARLEREVRERQAQEEIDWRSIRNQASNENALNEKLNSVEVGCERAKDVEGQIGALVLDALLYSDKIIRSAKASAKGISNQTRQTIEEAASGVDEIGEDISQMSDNFGVVVASLVSKINSLSSNLNSVADKLDTQDEEIDEHQFTFGENGEVKLPKLTDEDFGDPTEPEIEISDEEINNLVNVLNASGGLDLKFTAPDESSENVTEDIHSEEDISDEPVKADEAEEISELTKKFLGED